MGAADFTTYAPGADANAAFRAAREQAQHDYGHAGYTGTIAEKGDFTVIVRTPLPEAEASALAQRLMDEDDHRIADKWGPAGAIPVKRGTRTVTVTGLSGTVPDCPTREEQQAFTDQAAAAAREQGLLQDGEEPVAASLFQYDSVRARTAAYPRYGSPLRAMRTPLRFTNGTANLTVRRSPDALAAQTTPDGWLFFGYASE